MVCVTPSATPEHNSGWLDSSSIPMFLRCFLRPSLTEVPSLHRSYPGSSVVRTSPPPHTARPGSRELPVDPDLRSPLGLPVLHLIHSVCMPSPLPRQVRWNRFAHDCSIVVGPSQITVGSAPALHCSRPAQRSLALQPADSPSRLMRPSTPEAPAALLPPPPLRLLPGGAIQFPGGFISRCGPTPFTAHCKRLFTTTDTPLQEAAFVTTTAANTMTSTVSCRSRLEVISLRWRS